MPDAADETTPDPKRLRWRCRRALLELDLLFEAYLEKGYPQSSDSDKADFLRLLEQPDQELQAWLLGKEPPEDQSLGPIVQRIRESI